MWKWIIAAAGGVIGISLKSMAPFIPEHEWWLSQGFDRTAPFVFNIGIPFLTGYLVALFLLWILEFWRSNRGDPEPVKENSKKGADK